jgi:pimeloyl-ACP methyl ester carboxylesterase
VIETTGALLRLFLATPAVPPRAAQSAGTACDELLSLAQEEALAAAIPASRLVIYEDTGHLVLWEQPERVASDLITFIESLPAGTPDEP